MKLTSALMVMLAVMAGAAVGCGSSNGSNDAGTTGTGGTGGTTGGATRGDQCGQVMQSLCARVVACALLPATDMATCVSEGTTACCTVGGGNCGQSVSSTQAQIDTCKTALSAAACTDLAMEIPVLPESCLGVVRSSALTTASALSTRGSSLGSRAGALISQ